MSAINLLSGLRRLFEFLCRTQDDFLLKQHNYMWYSRHEMSTITCGGQININVYLACRFVI